MKTVGLITEYNPFHNGHLYHIEQAKKITGATHVIVVMSGDFVQRGAPAIMPKHLRAEMALRCGASAVFELPVCYATGSAERFAMGAVSLLDSLGVVDAICFGSECNNLEDMQKIAEILASEPKEYKTVLKEGLRAGHSFPTARQEAISRLMKREDCSVILGDPNNILGIEYLKALLMFNSSIVPYTIKRRESNYHDDTLHKTFSSATAIRNLLAYSGSAMHIEHPLGLDAMEFGSILGELEYQVPKSCLELLKDNYHLHYPVYQDDFSLLLKYRLLSKSTRGLCKYMDISEELASRIKKNQNYFLSYTQFCEQLKTKELTYTRINRALLHILLGIKESDYKMYQKENMHYYAHLLGFRKDSQKILTAIHKKSTLPLLTKLTNTDEIASTGLHMLKRDIFAADLYESVVTERYKTTFENEYTKQVIRV